MTIRGGGHPKQAMVLTPVSRLGPPPRSFAADAHDCIMVRSLWTYRIQGCGAILRARWQAPLGPLCCPTKKITGARPKSALTENAPYKAIPVPVTGPQRGCPWTRKLFAHSIQPYQPSPKGLSGRPAHRPFRDAMGQTVGEMAPSSLEATRRWSIPCQNSTT